MYGAILGDIIGSPYEFDFNNYKAKDFPLFSKGSCFTDDSVITLAVAQGLMNVTADAGDGEIKESLVSSVKTVGRRYPYCGYGGRFSGWLFEEDTEPYGSYGNGSAMRVSSAAWLYGDMDSVRRAARLTAEITHNHPEGVKGAESTAAAIFMARTGRSKAEIKDYMTGQFGYNLSRSCDEIRPGYTMNESCQKTVPEAITAFLESCGFEDALRTAVSLGGDSDTLAAITGSIAEGFYGVPEELKTQCRLRLPPDLLEILERYDRVMAGLE